ncbi:iron chelate uptake ABC transporter family permease subunit [Hydrogenibacillus schlegelii]|uniref:Uncharacterized protein n=1 Tax=Hydrogenibacillus schlegelii TaxID=1484 RepID=A0A132NAL8_HYDSH|nr:iron chelate uptake ABC transporter family permease subunit [Hydrogenibacillus schlegelii]KWX06602.1 hypothetical protein TR75_05440 [Hydrogenibacillus schlegelii]OAR04348.1 hypothetical protein SA87_10015 [Hydrogenibacillus schlegelii]
MRVKRVGLCDLWLLPLAVCALLSGRYDLPLSEIIRPLFHPALGSEAAIVIYHIRIPRIALALVVGGALAASGAAYQNMFHTSSKSGGPSAPNRPRSGSSLIWKARQVYRFPSNITSWDYPSPNIGGSRSGCIRKPFWTST